MGIRLPLLVLVVTLAGLATRCGGREHAHEAGRADVETTLVFINHAETSGLFPRVRDTARITRRGAVLADPNASRCDSATNVHPQDWPTTATTAHSKYVRALTLRLPPGYTARKYGAAFEETKDQWSHILGSWSVQDSGRQARRGAEGSLAMWIGAEEGYPTSGLPLSTQQ